MSRLKVIGKMDHIKDKSLEMTNRVYDITGISPTINCCGGGGTEPKVLVKNEKNNF